MVLCLFWGSVEEGHLARALLQRPKILLMDEATSSVDSHADAAIQQELSGGALAGTTQLVVAHRLRTVLDADLVYVLDNGHVIEYGSPKSLLLSSQVAGFERPVARFLA